MITTTYPPPPPGRFRPHPIRGRANAAFFHALAPVLERSLGPRKRRVYADLPSDLVEIGPGAGANLRHVPPGTTLIALEPNPHMHPALRAAARRRGVRLRLHAVGAERTGLSDGSADAVISSLVLCSVADPAAALAEIRRILRPGGTFRFVEHVAAPPGTATRALQRALRRPWAWAFEGCSCERDLEGLLRQAGFVLDDLERYRIRTPFVTFNTQIAGIARVA
ncbi:class I SAM-dependent methyltransferase [Agromyces seonyuensis]|uniref:Methyltransferase domain-containing protein n=1 Tax=Agromyces seonyuensis TaxID=2662446 RepID=A0A6I4NS89_9MICO|nr:class I SAM-dependent methyltransferase [Agromyces seonyuensis]MWB96991.1 methyltransferase domain-containing protein [Agromyces seonyuensis]